MKNKKKVAIKAPKRNLFTLLVVIGGLVVAFFIAATIYSYASLTKYEPFADEKYEKYNLENAKYIDGDDFEDFNLDFKCTKFNLDEKNPKAVFEITTSKFEGQEIEVENITINICLSVDYLECKYSGEKTSHQLEGSSSKQTYTMDSINLPTTVDAFPFDIKIKEPVAYVYLSYKVKTVVGNETKIKTNTYVLKYEYEDFGTPSGGINN